MIYSVFDKKFQNYGKVLENYDLTSACEAIKKIPMPETAVKYEPSIATLEYESVFGKLQNNEYGGMPIQFGLCWGYNTSLTALEYHRDSEVNFGPEDFILLVAKREEIEDGKIDSSKVVAFRVPAGTAVEVYATTLHYSPCQTSEKGFKAAIILPKGTNTKYPEIEISNAEDKMLRACNKWLLAHKDSKAAELGAYVGLTGKIVTVADFE